MSFKWQMDKETVRYPYHGTQTAETHDKNMGELQMSFAKQKKPDSKCHTLCDSVYRIFWERHNYRNRSIGQPLPKDGGTRC